MLAGPNDTFPDLPDRYLNFAQKTMNCKTDHESMSSIHGNEKLQLKIMV